MVTIATAKVWEVAFDGRHFIAGETFAKVSAQRICGHPRRLTKICTSCSYWIDCKERFQTAMAHC